MLRRFKGYIGTLFLQRFLIASEAEQKAFRARRAAESIRQAAA